MGVVEKDSAAALILSAYVGAALMWASAAVAIE